jgi:dihydrolipoamide dehydrogenase
MSEANVEVVYDVVIIGSGPAGYTAAIRGGQLNLKVALIEKTDVLGGTCLHVGCIPTKTLLFNAEIWDHLKHASEYGIDNVSDPVLNWESVLKRKDMIVNKHTKGLEFLMKKNKVTVINGYGKLTGPAKDQIHTIEVSKDSGDKTMLKAKNVILATGSEARMMFGLTPDDRILTNIEILSIPKVPKSLIVIGAGAVGIEFASIFRSYGTETAIVEFLPRLMPPEDEDISKELTRLFKKRGIDLNTSCKVEKVERTADGVKVSWTTSNGALIEREAEKVLIAVGRSPRTADVGIETTKIELDRGFVKVYEAQETAEPGIYAIGDMAAGLPQLAHVGGMSGVVAVTKIAGRSFKPVRRDRIPACTYSEPQIGSVGLTEVQAKERGYEVKIGKFPFGGNSKASIIDNHDGFVKMVADAKTRNLLGVHIIGPSATELVAEAVAVLELNGTC